MAQHRDQPPVSFWFWFFALFVMALPCIGAVMVVVWAFTGENESRKNYFRALIAWFLILSAVWTVVLLLGFWPRLEAAFQEWSRPR